MSEGVIERLLAHFGYYPKETAKPHCGGCDELAEHITQRAPGMGVDYWCENCCPVCNAQPDADRSEGER